MVQPYARGAEDGLAVTPFSGKSSMRGFCGPENPASGQHAFYTARDLNTVSARLDPGRFHVVRGQAFSPSEERVFSPLPRKRGRGSGVGTPSLHQGRNGVAQPPAGSPEMPREDPDARKGHRHAPCHNGAGAGAFVFGERRMGFRSPPSRGQASSPRTPLLRGEGLDRPPARNALAARIHASRKDPAACARQPDTDESSRPPRRHP